MSNRCMNKENNEICQRNRRFIDPAKQSPFRNDILQQLRLLQLIDQDRQGKADQQRDRADQQTQDICRTVMFQDVQFIFPPIHYSQENAKFLTRSF